MDTSTTDQPREPKVAEPNEAKLPVSRKVLEDPVSVVRRILAEDKGQTPSVWILYKKAGMSRGLFVLIRKLLIVKDNPALSNEEKEQITKALEDVRMPRNRANVQRQTKAIFDRHWQERTREGTTVEQLHKTAKHTQRFDNMLFGIRELCFSLDDFEVPPLEVQKRLDAIRIINTALFAFSLLLSKTLGGTDAE